MTFAAHAPHLTANIDFCISIFAKIGNDALALVLKMSKDDIRSVKTYTWQ